MARADDQRARDQQADGRIAGERRLSLAEWLVLCLVREEPTYGLVVAGLLDYNGSLGRVGTSRRGRCTALCNGWKFSA